MPVNNLNYLYESLPARFRRDDADLFLKRFLTFFGMELDGFDLKLDTFYQLIAPETAPPEFIDWWLYSFFGWGWFPTWFTLARRRTFYAAIARHYAERGTIIGIREFLAAFGLRVIVEKDAQYFGEDVWGEDVWSVVGPLGIVVRLFPEGPGVDEDLVFFEDDAWGDSYGASPGEIIRRADVDEMLRFVWPLGNIIMIEDIALAA